MLGDSVRLVGFTCALKKGVTCDLPQQGRPVSGGVDLTMLLRASSSPYFADGRSSLDKKYRCVDTVP